MSILGIRMMALSRERRLGKMTEEDLERLNIVLMGKGHNWATAERIEVCKELGKRMQTFFNV
jgi:hypothetical protein